MASSELVIAKGIAIGRALVGVAAMTAPRRTLGQGGAAATGPFLAMTRTFGVRDLVLGAGTYLALAKDQESALLWVQAGALADTLDVANALLFRSEHDKAGRLGIIGLAVPAALGGIYASRKLRTG